jgi:hypothetical protein
VDLDLVFLLEAAQQLLVDVSAQLKYARSPSGLRAFGVFCAARTVNGSPIEYRLVPSAMPAVRLSSVPRLTRAAWSNRRTECSWLAPWDRLSDRGTLPGSPAAEAIDLASSVTPVAM